MLIVIPMRALRAAPPCTAAGASALDRGVAHGDAFFDGRPEWSGGPDFLGPIHAAKWADFYKCLAHQRLALPMVAPGGRRAAPCPMAGLSSAQIGRAHV